MHTRKTRYFSSYLGNISSSNYAIDQLLKRNDGDNLIDKDQGFYWVQNGQGAVITHLIKGYWCN